ncbi:thiamine phosphate synthase [Qipengyuania thermophila]|uniref:thiamine phosphate synthase n=1 Tax=Qipengyuania thermophila TaxID=2509361 RepID=UPI001F388B3A|nr:thiamine phosphate synthase [Qipengyuania thermophila]
MPDDQPLPRVWLLTDARNDAVLDQAISALPPGSGVVFRHYHLSGHERQDRFAGIAAAARAAGHRVVLSASADEAAAWGADGAYGPLERLAPSAGLLRLAAAHDRRELLAAAAARVDGIFLSPVFPTRSHPGAPALGPDGFKELASLTRVPVIALGGMTAARARAMGWPRWGAIDGLAAKVRSRSG